MADVQAAGRFVIADNAAASSEVDLRGMCVKALVIPPSWVAADIRFEAKVLLGAGDPDTHDFLPTPLVISVVDSQYRLLTSDEAGAAEGLSIARIRSVDTADPDADENQTGGPLSIIVVGHPRN